MTMGSGGPIDQDAIVASASVFQDRVGDCVQRVRYKNSRDGPYEATLVSAHEARLTVSPGIHQRGGYFDIKWWENGDYRYHYQEQGLEFRFGREADNEDTALPVNHFHPPSDPSRHVRSCIDDGHPPERVTLAVTACWLPAVRESDPSVLNDQQNPP